MYNILICDDEKDIVSALKIYLEAEGYKTFAAFNGLEAIGILHQEDIQLVLMDIMMPEMDGISAMVKIREESNVPVILLTAKGEDTDKILGLNVGADDYITKPFNPVEMLARVRSQLRRYMQLGGGAVRENLIRMGGVCMDDRSKEVTVDGEAVSLTPREYDILKFLMQHPGRGISAPGDLPPGLGRRALRGREHRGRPYPAPAGKNRDQPSRAQIHQSRLGAGV